MKLKFFGAGFISQLHATADTNGPKYGGDISWLETLAAGKPYAHESNIVVDQPPQLIVSDDNNAANDAENAKRLFTWLRSIPPTLAMEERLWAYLTHCTFADYMKARWPAENASAIERRYLFEGSSFAALSRNGIARLWWAGFLTHDAHRSNPFELTETLFMRQDIQVSLLERSIGKCRNVREAVLEFIGENMHSLAAEAFGRRIQRLLKELNLLGGVAILDALPRAELRAFLQKVGEGFIKETSA